MSEPIFLEIDQILKLHQKSLDLFGGSTGLRPNKITAQTELRPPDREGLQI